MYVFILRSALIGFKDKQANEITVMHNLFASELTILIMYKTVDPLWSFSSTEYHFSFLKGCALISEFLKSPHDHYMRNQRKLSHILLAAWVLTNNGCASAWRSWRASWHRSPLLTSHIKPAREHERYWRKVPQLCFNQNKITVNFHQTLRSPWILRNWRDWRVVRCRELSRARSTSLQTHSWHRQASGAIPHSLYATGVRTHLPAAGRSLCWRRLRWK